MTRGNCKRQPKKAIALANVESRGSTNSVSVLCEPYINRTHIVCYSIVDGIRNKSEQQYGK